MFEDGDSLHIFQIVMLEMYNFLVHMLETLVFNAGTWKSQPFCLVGNFTLLQNLGSFWSSNKNHPKNEK